jgi:hypothetical protein
MIRPVIRKRRNVALVCRSHPHADKTSEPGKQPPLQTAENRASTRGCGNSDVIAELRFAWRCNRH